MDVFLSLFTAKHWPFKYLYFRFWEKSSTLITIIFRWFGRSREHQVSRGNVVVAIFWSKDDTHQLKKHSVITYTKIDLTNLMLRDTFRTESRYFSSSIVLFYLGQKTTLCLKFVAEKFIYNVDVRLLESWRIKCKVAQRKQLRNKNLLVRVRVSWTGNTDSAVNFS